MEGTSKKEEQYDYSHNGRALANSHTNTHSPYRMFQGISKIKNVIESAEHCPVPSE
jgi:hypothetical protein